MSGRQPTLIRINVDGLCVKTKKENGSVSMDVYSHNSQFTTHNVPKALIEKALKGDMGPGPKGKMVPICSFFGPDGAEIAIGDIWIPHLNIGKPSMVPKVVDDDTVSKRKRSSIKTEEETETEGTLETEEEKTVSDENTETPEDSPNEEEKPVRKKKNKKSEE